ncbi:type IV secretory system conjugative DNA transfer family protein [Faecalicoccus pleomorphus]|uniref:type IV secretory system conjugative DNA transfer family protein n=1 Tax=Faecalicoccus pleomorphus TaxID=1323 RepID=UPI0039F52F5A
MNQSNFLLNEDVQFSLDDRISGINSNIVLMGEPGCGKTSLMAYNMMHLLDRSHVVIDIKNKLYALAPYFQENGYTVYHFNLVNTSCSDYYNPYQFVQDGDKQMEDISTIAKYMIGDSFLQRDEYWENAANMFVNSALQYTYESMHPKYRYLDKTIELLRLMSMQGKNDRSFDFNTGGMMPSDPFKYLIELKDKIEDKSSYSTSLYELAINNAKETLACVQNVMHTHLYRFYTPSVIRLFSKNGIDFRSFLDKKTIIFIGLKDYDTSLHTTCAMFLTQLFQFLFRSADQLKSGRLPIPVQFWLDDFGSYKITDFASLIANGRSRGIGMTIGFHSLGQINKTYGEFDAQTILQCCSTMLFFGGDDMDGVQLVHNKTGLDSVYINDLPKRNVIFMQRGKESIVTKIYDISKEPKYGYWNYEAKDSFKHKKLEEDPIKKTEESFDIEKKINEIKLGNYEEQVPFPLYELHPLIKFIQKKKEKVESMYKDFSGIDPYETYNDYDHSFYANRRRRILYEKKKYK